MPKKKIHDLGVVSGTAKELAEKYQVTLGTMKGRISRYRAGKITIDRVLIVGRASFTHGKGNQAWFDLPDPGIGRPENLKLIPECGKFDVGKCEAGWKEDQSLPGSVQCD